MDDSPDQGEAYAETIQEPVIKTESDATTAIPTSIAISRCEVQIMVKVRVVFKVIEQKGLFRTTKVDVMVESVVLARGEVVHISSLVTI